MDSGVLRDPFNRFLEQEIMADEDLELIRQRRLAEMQAQVDDHPFH